MKAFNKKTLVIILIGVLIVFSLNFFDKGIKNFFYSVSLPFQQAFWKAGDNLSGFLESFGQRQELKQELDRFRFENRRLLAELASLRELEKENQILREALNIGLADDFSLIFAQVSGKDISLDYLLLNQGERNGVSENMPVISEQKVLVGRISEVYRDFSKVKLITDKDSSFDVKFSQKEIFGAVRGGGSLRAYLDLVPREEEVKEGDLLVTSALGGIFPRGLLVGRVVNPQKSDLEPFWRADVALFFNLRALENLFIIEHF